MKCKQYRNLIDDLIDNEPDGQSAAMVKEHVLSCSGCATLFETAKREKEICARYLFDQEPPVDLWSKFQTRLDAENKIIAPVAEPPAIVASGWKTNLFNLRLLNPALAGAVLIFVFGIVFVLLKFITGEKTDGLASVNKISSVENKSTAANSNPFEKKESNELLTDTKKPQKNLPPVIIKTGVENNFARINLRNCKQKNRAVATTIFYKQTTLSAKDNDSPKIAESSEIELRNLELRNLESETVRQIEKIELLLRSFRSAKSVAENGQFDIAYEKAQARKLLEKNIQLRQGAESYGTFHSEEILGRVEPYLLEISNLENNPSATKVREIKERVRNQNIIASLQSY